MFLLCSLTSQPRTHKIKQREATFRGTGNVPVGKDSPGQLSSTRQGTSGTASGVTQSDLEKDPGHSATKDQTCIGTDSDNGPNQPESADFFLKGT